MDMRGRRWVSEAETGTVVRREQPAWLNQPGGEVCHVTHIGEGERPGLTGSLVATGPGPGVSGRRFGGQVRAVPDVPDVSCGAQ